MISFKSAVFKEALKDTEFSERLEKTQSMQEVTRILSEFAEKRGYKIKELK
jgi:hypothetical protein